MAIGATNLDINSIVSQLMSVERRPLSKLDLQEASHQAKLSAYGSIKGAIADFQSALLGLNNAGAYQSLKATASDTTVFSASATSTAVAGTYSLEVTSLTQAQKLVAAGQTSTTDAIGTGASTTVTFDFGTISGTLDPDTGTYDPGASFTGNGNPSKSITIDSSNNSLQGIRDAINAAQVGVTATIVNDGSGTPYRLALSSNNSGASNSLRISVTGDSSVSDLLAHDPTGTQNLSETVTASNANFKVNGIPVTKTSNTITDVIDGVTLNLSKVTTSPVSLTVARDTSTVSSSISGFVKAYNDIVATLKNTSGYNAETKQGGILLGDSTVRQLQTQLRGMLNTAVVGTSGSLTRLSDVGVSFQRDGTLSVNQTKLNDAINNHFGDIASLFASVGKASDSLISFNTATSAAKPGSYAVSVSQIATQGKAVGGALTLPISITAGVDDTLSLLVNGISASVTLSAGDYATGGALAAELQSKINGVSALSSAGVSVAVSSSSVDGALTITSLKYGSTSSVDIADIPGEANLRTLLGLAAPTETAGVDAAGTIGGVDAVADGQKLSAESGGATGLSIIVNGGVPGDRGVLTYSQGYASILGNWATSVLSSDGMISSRTKGIDSSIKDIGRQRIEMERRLAAVEKRYRAQFIALDKMLSSMNQTSNYLTQQLAQLSNLT
jgi:flagellar hook-associated protein 2